MSIDPNVTKSKPRMLMLVEDSASNVLIATIVLTELGYEFHLANNGAEAVELFKNGLYSLILMDLQMPILSGIEATKLIRGHEINNKWTPTPIIALTANNTAKDREECIACGMDDFITKPYLPNDLALKIAGQLQQALLSNR